MLELVTGGSGSGKSAYAEEHICRIHRILSRKVRQKPSSFLYCGYDPPGRRNTQKNRTAQKDEGDKRISDAGMVYGYCRKNPGKALAGECLRSAGVSVQSDSQ